MLNIKPTERKFLESIFDNADEMFMSDTVNTILVPLDRWIALNGYDDNYDLTDEGRKAERIYDSLYANNLK